jgi:hypothetical protein
LRETWPHHFEITTRIAPVHESVFNTPKVRNAFVDCFLRIIQNPSQHAVDALYSDGLMANFYSKSNQTSDVCIGATRAFSGVLDALRESGKRSIRILEVGAGSSLLNEYWPECSSTFAGTGLLTYHLIDELKQNHPDLLVEYTVTDISYAVRFALFMKYRCCLIVICPARG